MLVVVNKRYNPSAFRYRRERINCARPHLADILGKAPLLSIASRQTKDDEKSRSDDINREMHYGLL
jgi:hypothetical protein